MYNPTKHEAIRRERREVQAEIDNDTARRYAHLDEEHEAITAGEFDDDKIGDCERRGKNKAMRIYNRYLYVIDEMVGVIGGPRAREIRVMLGRTVKERGKRLSVVRQLHIGTDPLRRSSVRLEDGRLPQFQEVMLLAEWVRSDSGFQAGHPSVVIVSGGGAR